MSTMIERLRAYIRAAAVAAVAAMAAVAGYKTGKMSCSSDSDRPTVVDELARSLSERYFRASFITLATGGHSPLRCRPLYHMIDDKIRTTTTT